VLDDHDLIDRAVAASSCAAFSMPLQVPHAATYLAVAR
jgi:hypothetical protein